MELNEQNQEALEAWLAEPVTTQEAIAVMEAFGLSDSEISEQLGLLGALQ